MKPIIWAAVLAVLLQLLHPCLWATTSVSAPVLKWQRGGCYSSWCETGWYSSPAVADLDNDGNMEIIGAAYTLFVLNAEDGSVQWSVDPAGGRVWAGVVVCDIDNDGDLEVITAHGDGYLHVFSHAGASVWSRRPVTRELRGLAAADIDDDGTMEIVVNGAVGSAVNTWVYEHNGDMRAGWPQLSNNTGYAYGVFNDNTAVGDIDGDGQKEIIVPSDVHYICAYRPDGTQVQANAIYGDKAWGKVGVWENYNTELRGWGYCSGARAERFRTNFAHGAAIISDVDNNGTPEIIVTGNVYDCAVGHPPGKYNGVYIFNPDRGRFNSGGYDWRTAPVDTGAPLSEDYGVIENNQPNPAAADLDGDGEKEIIYSSYDGRVHAFWLDKTEHHNWPYSVYSAGEGYYRFASEPLVADLDNDGFGEVVFTSWVRKNSGRTGKLHILNHQGTVLREINLPNGFGGVTWNGALPAPTLADTDGDADLELVMVTSHSGILVYDLPGTGNARVLWGTGRGNFKRNGTVDRAPDVSPDFNGDGYPDILWRFYGSPNSGQNFIWHMKGVAKPSAYTKLTKTADPDWKIAGTGDLNGDGMTDILWRYHGGNRAGRIVAWCMDRDGNILSVPSLPRVANLDWKIQGVDDFNGDGHQDLLWRYYGTGPTGSMTVWLMNGVTFQGLSAVTPKVADTDWHIVGTGDFNGDGKTDIVWRNRGAQDAGRSLIWMMDGTTQSGAPLWLPRQQNLDWKIQGVMDFNRDGNMDILWRYYGPGNTGKNLVWLLNRGTWTGSALLLARTADPDWVICN